MKTETRELLGFEVPVVGVLETLAEAHEKLGSEVEIIDTINAQVLAHSHFTILRRVIVKKVVELTGIKQLTKTEGEKVVIIEKDAAYIARLETELGEGQLQAQYGEAIKSACAAVPVDYSPSSRGTGSSKPAKKWLDYYDALVAQGKIDGFCSKYGITRDGKEEEAFKWEVANKCREVVTAAQQKVAQEALGV